MYICPVSTSPVRCSYFTLGNPKKVILNSIIYTYFWLFMLSQRKQTVIHLPTPPENVTTNLWTAKLFHLTEGLLHSFKCWKLQKSQLWVVVGASEKNRLWCVATGMSGKQCCDKCSEWPPSALIHASSLFQHWSATSACLNMPVSIHVLLL